MQTRTVVQVVRTQVNMGNKNWTAEASSLTLRPGEWPTRIVVGVADTFDFFRFSYAGTGEDREITGARYVAPDGWVLEVFND